MLQKILILISLYCITTEIVLAKELIINKEQSKINYSLSCLGIPFKKKSLPLEGQINLTKQDKQAIDLHSLNVKGKFVSKDPLFKKVINYEKYPNFHFSTTSEQIIKLKENKKTEFEGNLSFHGITKKVKLKLKNKSQNNVISLTGSMNIKMTDFGIKPPKILLLQVDNVIKSKIELYSKV